MTLPIRSTSDKCCKGDATRCKLCLLCWKDPQEFILLSTRAAPFLTYGQATGASCWAATVGTQPPVTNSRHLHLWICIGYYRRIEVYDCCHQGLGHNIEHSKREWNRYCSCTICQGEKSFVSTTREDCPVLAGASHLWISVDPIVAYILPRWYVSKC